MSKTTVDEFVTGLPGARQVAVALALIRRGLPLWEAHVREHPEQLAAVSALIDDEHRVAGGGTMICPGLLGEIVEWIERALADGADLQGDPILHGILGTLMAPLTNAGWEGALTPPMRLLYASVYNLLVALVFRRLTPEGETHVSVAVDQACSALLQAGAVDGEALGALVEASAEGAPRDARDPLVAEDDSAIDGPRDGYSRFLTAIKREHVRCPRCSSTRVRTSPVGIEFTQITCDACGENELADEWQLDDWYV